MCLEVSNEKDYNKIVKDNFQMVKKIVSTMHRKYFHVEREELLHWGNIGLWQAAKNYEPSDNNTFETYASHRVKGHILDELRALDGVTRTERRKIKTIEATKQKLEASSSHRVTDGQIAQSCGLDLDEYFELKALNGLFATPPVSSSVDQGDEMEDEILRVPDHAPEVYYNIQIKQEKKIVSKYIDQLAQRDKKILELLYDKDLSLKESGEALGVSESRICQIHADIIRKIRKSLPENMMCSIEQPKVKKKRKKTKENPEKEDLNSTVILKVKLN